MVNPRKARIRVFSDVLNGSENIVVCRQCVKPPCMEACTIGAIEIDKKSGISKINASKCVGCMKCIEACPFGAMFFDSQKNIAIKCDLCDGDPECVKYCRAIPHIGHPAIAYVDPAESNKKRVR